MYVIADKFYFIISLHRSSYYSYTWILANDFFIAIEIISYNDGIDDNAYNVNFLSFLFILHSCVFLFHWLCNSSRQLLVPFDEPATFVNLALLITFTLALVQALLSLIGAVISCLWSPCCTNPVPTYKPIATNSHYSQTTPHRFDVRYQILPFLFIFYWLITFFQFSHHIQHHYETWNAINLPKLIDLSLHKSHQIRWSMVSYTKVRSYGAITMMFSSNGSFFCLL